MHRVAVLALDGVIPFELGIPARVFGAAVGPAGEPLYDVVVCTVDGEPVRTAAGFTIAVDHTAEILGTANTVVLAPVHPQHADSFPGAGSDEPDERNRFDDPRSVALVATALARVTAGTRLVSICTASSLLAATGWLDGRRATTHWLEAERLARMYPQVTVDADVLFVDDGDVLTSAGAASGIDLCLHLVRRDHGSEVANRAARRCVVPPWRDGGQAQYIERPVPPSSGTSTASTREWMLRRLGEPTSLSELAAHAHMSVRTFSRRFRDEVGLPPGQWLTGQRVERARHLLESSDLPFDEIARHTGFATGISLRQHFRTATGVSPTAYRQTFRDRDGTGVLTARENR
ncbi:GlxA family transcriptional regulator [Parafrankia sp. EUN1f]|uniref:GlxA family transcriptional regulator n=1 Tax=Parafrankia sp. EUN1f TaxID=102897 RepID=UPI0001C451F1|nr:helix-turn-helix domain-containing protein [Parafrankia sp. EUN1f]EFC82828.1 transcriptional regulator, AraC family [Parafrankia sp. EUN1f]